MKTLTLLTLPLLAVLAGAALRASCVAEEPYLFLVRLEVDSCETVAEHTERVLESTPLPWLRSLADRKFADKPGVVLNGTVISSVAVVEVEGRYALDSSGAEVTDGSWFLADPPADCRVLEELVTLEVFQDVVCCDLFPPSDVPCFFGIRAAKPAPEELAGLAP